MSWWCVRVCVCAHARVCVTMYVYEVNSNSLNDSVLFGCDISVCLQCVGAPVCSKHAHLACFQSLNALAPRSQSHWPESLDRSSLATSETTPHIL